jgi:acetylornithine deacetylase
MNPPSNVTELLAFMVSVDTVNARFAGRPSGEAKLAMQLEQLAGAWGLQTRRYDVDRDAFNLLVYHERARTADWLLGESHLDTVSVAGMTVAPFEAATRDGRIYGRGTCDTKGSGAAMLWALQDVARSGRAARNVGVLFTVDEEAGMTGAAAFARETLPQWPGKIRGIVVGEPTLLRPVIATNGVARWTTVTHGVAAHSADPSRGRSAISGMLKVVEALESRYVPTAKRTHPLTGSAAASVNVIRGGTQVNIIPERCEIEVDRRLVPGETAMDALAERDRIIADVRKANRGLEVENIEPAYVVPPVAPEGNVALHAWLAPALRSLGLSESARGAPYVTNGSHYAAAGAPVIVLGPGDIAQAHTKDEWLAAEQLQRAVEVYRALMTAP